MGPALAAALSNALSADEQTLRAPVQASSIEHLARRIALHALKGGPSARKRALSLLNAWGEDAAGTRADTD